MNFLFIPENIIQAIGRTFVHSLWQGLLAAAIAGIIIIATKKSKAAIRYNLLSFVFIGFIITSLITLLIQPGILLIVQTDGAVVRFTPGTTSEIPDLTATENKWLPALNKETFYQSIIHYTDKYATAITAIWLLFFCIQLLKMSAGLHYAHRIRYRHTIEPITEWQQRLQEMTHLLGIREIVSLMESGIIKVPVVTGFLKPMILVPLGMLSNLPIQQVEAILLHELAHVRRKDFLINLFQHLAESIFFFNPFIVWISARIREEREACCDDIVLEYNADKRSYLEALVSFREADTSAYSHAMSLGRNNKLLYRVKRMITQENKKLNAMEKLTLVLILTAATAVSFMPAGKEDDGKQNDKNGQQVKSLSQEEKQPVPSFTISHQTNVPDRKDTLPGKELITFNNISSVNNDDGEKRSSIVTAKGSNGKTYSYRIENGEITDLAIDGVKMKKEDFHLYQPLIDQIEIIWEERTRKEFMKEQMDANMQLNKQQLLNEKMLMLKAAQALNLDNDMNKLMLEKIQSENDLNVQNKLLLKMKSGQEYDMANNRNKLMLEKIQSENDLNIQNKLLLKMKSGQEYDMANDRNKLMLEKIQSENLTNLHEKIALQERQDLQSKQELNLLQHKLKNELLVAQDEQFHDSNYQLSSIIADMAEAGVITDKTNFSVTLNNNELIVDGKKQSSSLHERLRKKYIRHKNDHYIYRAKPNSRSTDVYVE